MLHQSNACVQELENQMLDMELSVGVLCTQVNTLAPMEVDLIEEEPLLIEREDTVVPETPVMVGVDEDEVFETPPSMVGWLVPIEEEPIRDFGVEEEEQGRLTRRRGMEEAGQEADCIMREDSDGMPLAYDILSYAELFPVEVPLVSIWVIGRTDNSCNTSSSGSGFSSD